ncbi:MAG TPA: glycoside hydrolase family 97 protein [Candidatus Saccharicenans sp.]|mgnify:CR=1 FL=1|nr:glycoside hydrolase family 97 protein [Candidatus Saccharicenans sp.]HQO76158.1 glycoside hydrolase family 97 protein [Candidatus Saccharicenans sp.]HUM78936.1 glycoside hydrolase family 97 protein [Candidatus Saccharicenans sp.]
MKGKKLPGLMLGCLLLVICCSYLLPQARTNSIISVKSPNEKIELRIDLRGQILYSIYFDSREVISPSPISMTINDNVVLGKRPVLENLNRTSVDEKIFPAVREKRAVVADRYEQVNLKFRGNFGLIFRVYDDGVAYRFYTGYRVPIKVRAEEATFTFPENYHVYFPFITSFHTSFESTYSYLPLKDIGPDRFGYAPVVVELNDGFKVAVTDVAVDDYPGMFLTGNKEGLARLTGKFAGYPAEEKLRQGSDRELEVVQEANYLAETRGNRQYPWRLVVLAENDAQLVSSDIVYRLSPPTELKDTTWIKPGKVAWDWWNALNIFGVDFKSGVNTETYKYYVDFASKYGLEYIILDEGWSDPADLFKINPELNLEEVVRYAESKKVGVILWCVWYTLDRQMDQALDYFQRIGVKGIKVDFMDRDDQKMVNFYRRCAAAAAKRHLLVDFHGAHKPVGLRRAFPNILNKEGVLGLETSKWAATVTPEHDLLIPFIRMIAGPMDFTPGAMRNAQEKQFRPIYDLPMSQGTRCHQLAMYIIYESPLQMLCDSPSTYLREPEIMEFLSAVPTVWDETRVLEAKIGDYLVVARQHGDDWYVGAMTDWSPRTMEIKVDFLESGKKWIAEVWQDGVNADRYAADYKKLKFEVNPIDSLKINLAPGGGLAIRFTPAR